MSKFDVRDYMDEYDWDDYDDEDKERYLADLTGGIYLDRWGEDGEQGFCCGPEIQRGFLSDTFSIYDVMEQILTPENIGIAIDFGLSENTHQFGVSYDDEGN